MTHEEAIKWQEAFKKTYNGCLSAEKAAAEEACNMAIELFKKQIPMKPKYTHIKYGKHKWKRDEKGNVDEWAWDLDYHNGVMCEVCGECYCIHCDPNYDKREDCEVENWNCPVCNRSVYKTKWCPECGQMLDWSDMQK